MAILSYFVWKPLVASIDQRRKTIADGLAAADLQKQALARAQIEQVKILAQAREEAKELVTQTRQGLQAERMAAEKMLAREREKLVVNNRQDLEEARRKLEHEVRTATAQLIVTALKRILATTNDQSERWLPIVTKVMKDLE